MQDNHYNGRITAPLNDYQRAFGLVPEGGSWADDLIDWSSREFKRPGDARRLTACWNALLGVDTALIEDGRLFALLAPPFPCTMGDTEAFAKALSATGWASTRSENLELLRNLLNEVVRTHAPAASIAHNNPKLSRSNSEQEASYLTHGADFKARMVTSFAFARQLEIENRILRDLVRHYEVAGTAPRYVPDPDAAANQAPALSEGAKS